MTTDSDIERLTKRFLINLSAARSLLQLNIEPPLNLAGNDVNRQLSSQSATNHIQNGVRMNPIHRADTFHAQSPRTMCPTGCQWPLDLNYSVADGFDQRLTLYLRDRGFVNAPNKVPEHQRTYQAAYRSHQRIWRIVSLPIIHLRVTKLKEEASRGNSSVARTRERPSIRTVAWARNTLFLTGNTFIESP